MKTVQVNAKALYRTMHCSHKGYMTKNQGMLCLPDWIGLIKNRDGSPLHHWEHEHGYEDSVSPTILEIGCGNGMLCEYLSLFAVVAGMDITDSPVRREGNCDYEFYEQDATEGGLPGLCEYDYILSFDVFEHLAAESIVTVIHKMRIANHLLIKVACNGAPPLHMTVKPPSEWLEFFMAFAPDHNWSIIRTYRREDAYSKGNVTFSPLFYGRKEQ